MSLLRIRDALRWIGRHELGFNVSVAAFALGLLAFAKVASEVREGDLETLDRSVIVALRAADDWRDPVGPRWLEEVARDITALGGVSVLTMLSVAVVGYLLLARRRRAALFVVASVLGATASSFALKSVFARPRPALVPHLAHVQSASFPSGHSMLSASVYLTLGAMLARMEPRLPLKAYFLTCALVFTILVGASRVYLGVHWPSDVVAGWAAGAAWASGSWLIAHALQQRGRLESARD